MSTLNETDSGFDWRSHLLAYAFATSFLFGLVSVLNTLGLTFFLNYPKTIHIMLVDAQIDLLVWVTSVLCISVFAIWFSKNQRRGEVRIGAAMLGIVLSMALVGIPQDWMLYRIIAYILFACTIAQFIFQSRWKAYGEAKYPQTILACVLIYIFSYLLIIETSSAAYYAIRSFSIPTNVGSIDAGIETQFAYVTYGLIPWLYVGFLFSWVWVPILRSLVSKNRLFQVAFGSVPGQGQGLLAESSSGNWFSTLSDPRLLLVLAVAFFIGYYPYFQNPPWLVGTDAYWRYYDPLLGMNAKGIIGGFSQAFGERHPVPLVIIYAVQLALHTTTFEVLRYTPLFLSVALAFSIWWFLARRKSIGFGLVVFLLSVLSITTTVGFYSSIIANWMVLVGWIAFFAYASHRADEKFRFLDFLVLLAISTLMLLVHPWTWGVLAATTVLAAAFALTREKRRALRSGGLLLIVILLDVVFAVLSITLLPNSQGWRVGEALDLYTIVVRQPWRVLFFWSALTRLTEIWAPFFNSLYLALSILGVLCLATANLSAWRRRFILAWICVSALGSLLVAPIGFDPTRPTQTESQLWRLLFLTPFQLTAPLGIAWLVQLPNRLWSHLAERLGKSERRLNLLRGFWFVLLLVSGLVLSLAPVWARFLLVFLPLFTALLLRRAGRSENAFLSDLMLALFMLVAFNNTARSLSLLLIDPHNYRP